MAVLTAIHKQRLTAWRDDEGRIRLVYVDEEDPKLLSAEVRRLEPAGDE